MSNAVISSSIFIVAAKDHVSEIINSNRKLLPHIVTFLDKKLCETLHLLGLLYSIHDTNYVTSDSSTLTVTIDNSTMSISPTNEIDNLLRMTTEFICNKQSNLQLKVIVSQPIIEHNNNTYITATVSEDGDNISYQWTIDDNVDNTKLIESIKFIMNGVHSHDTLADIKTALHLDIANEENKICNNSVLDVLTLTIASFLRKPIVDTTMSDIANHIDRVIGIGVKWNINDPIYDIITHMTGIVSNVTENTITVQLKNGTTEKFSLYKLQGLTQSLNDFSTSTFLGSLYTSFNRNRIIKQYHIIDTYSESTIVTKTQ